MPSVQTNRLSDSASALEDAADLSQLNICVWCPDPLVEEALMASLAAEGAAKPIRPEGWDHLLTLLNTAHPDILYALVSPATLPQIAELFRGIRNGEIGSNPFLALDVITRYPQSPVLETMVDAGADDILPYRWPQRYVSERLVHLALRRKKFVVTSSYVGPDRRRAPRPEGAGHSEPLFDVPNPVKAKAIDQITTKELAGQVEVARDQIMAERMMRLGLLLARCILDIRESTLAPRDGMLSPLTMEDKRAIAAATVIIELGQRIDGTTRWNTPAAGESIKLARLIQAMSHEGTEHPDVKPLQVAAKSFLTRFSAGAGAQAPS